MNIVLTSFIMIVSLFSAVACSVDAVRKRPPGDVSTFSMALAWVGLLVHIALSCVVVFAQGLHAHSSTVEFFAYLVTVAFMPPVAVFWSLLERSAQSSWMLAVTNIVVIVMVFRMAEIWYGSYTGAFS